MASRRSRNRPNKRAVDFDLPAPDIERAFEKLTAERRVREPAGDEGDTIITRDGTTVDLRAPWPMPGHNTI